MCLWSVYGLRYHGKLWKCTPPSARSIATPTKISQKPVCVFLSLLSVFVWFQSDVQPTVDYDSDISAEVGSKVNISIRLTPPLNISISYYTLSLDLGAVETANLSVCDFILVGVGEAFPCGVPVIETAINYTRTSASITIGPVHYFGMMFSINCTQYVLGKIVLLNPFYCR